MNLSVGIVGLPNVGKSTLFTALTKKQVDAANYPFCTIDPNIGNVAVPDERLDALAKVYNSEKVVPTVVEFVDIAGLVKGAHKGEGLGNAFLSNIREVAVICHVSRAFTDPNVVHVGGKVNPEEDRQTINLELIYADLATLQKRIVETQGTARSGDKEAKAILAVYEKVKQGLDEGKLISELKLIEEERALLKDLNLLTIKPVINVLNVDEGDVAKEFPGYLPISAKVEAELAEMSPADAKEYLQSLGLERSGLDRLILKAYETLGLITFLTAGPQETRAWTVKNGATAPQAGGEIHTDFEQRFIRAEVCNWRDIISYNGEVGAKAAGKVRTEGREYVIKDGDVIYFRIA